MRMGLTTCRQAPTWSAQQKAMASTDHKVFNRSSSLKCVASKFNPLACKACNKTSIFPLFLYASRTCSDASLDTRITYSPEDKRLPVTPSPCPQRRRGPRKVQEVETGKLLKTLRAGAKGPCV